MTKVADEAGVFIHDLLLSSSTPAFLKEGARDALKDPSVRERQLRSQVAMVRDDTLPQPARLAAMRRVVDFFRGDT